MVPFTIGGCPAPPPTSSDGSTDAIGQADTGLDGDSDLEPSDTDGQETGLTDHIDAPDAEVGDLPDAGDANDSGGADAVPDGDDDDAEVDGTDVLMDAKADALTDADVDLTVCLQEGDDCQPPFNITCQEGRCDAELNCLHIPIEGCCYKDSNCDLSQSVGCLEMRCLGNQCALLHKPGCCDAATSCPETGCAEASCEEGRCRTCPADDGCTCPSNPVTSQAGFGGTVELSDSGFFVTDYDLNDAVTWAVDTKRWARQPASLYLGDPQCRTYYTGALSADCQPLTDGSDATPVKLVLYSPTINLSAGFNTSGAGKVAMFALWADVEDVAGPADSLSIVVDEIGAQFVSWPVANSESVGKDTQGQWRVLAVDLAPFEGKIVRLRLEFDTVDNQDNLHEGLYLDDWQVVDRCAGGGCCTTDADCSVPSGVSDPCVAARCIPLSDGGGSVCATVTADPGEPCLACATDADCEDGNPCTSDSCSTDGTCLSQVFCCFEEFGLATEFDPEDGYVPDLPPTEWTILDAQPDDDVGWVISASNGAADSTSLWCGDPGTGTYAASGPVTTTASTPTIAIPAVLPGPGSITAQFWVNLETEWQGGDYTNPLGVDRLSVEVMTGSGTLEVWSSDLIMGSSGGAWVPVTIDLSTWAGQSISLGFSFDTVDDAANDFGGPFVDGLRVGRSCD